MNRIKKPCSRAESAGQGDLYGNSIAGLAIALAIHSFDLIIQSLDPACEAGKRHDLDIICTIVQAKWYKSVSQTSNTASR